MNIEHLKDQHGSVKIGQKSESIGIRGPLGMASSNNVHRYGFDLFQKVLGPGSSPGPTPGLIESQISNCPTLTTAGSKPASPRLMKRVTLPPPSGQIMTHLR